MKVLTTLLTTSLLAANAYAVDIYHGLADGNPDLASWRSLPSEQTTGVQPGVGDAPSGFRGGHNRSLFKSPASETSSANRVDIYGGFQSQDLSTTGGN
jgi:hypothetical protein